MFRWCVPVYVVLSRMLLTYAILQADEAYNIGPAPSAESYVSPCVLGYSRVLLSTALAKNGQDNRYLSS